VLLRAVAAAGTGPQHSIGSSSYLRGQLPSSQLFASTHTKNNSIDIKMKKKRSVRHKDVLRNVLLDDLPPFHPGYSCGVTLCIEIQTQRHRDLLPTLIF